MLDPLHLDGLAVKEYAVEELANLLAAKVPRVRPPFVRLSGVEGAQNTLTIKLSCAGVAWTV